MKELKCIKCGETKESEFYPSSIKRSDYRCKKCVIIEHKKWIINNPDKFRMIMRNSVRKWASKHRKEYNKKCKEWRDNHPQEWYEIRMKYHYKNMEAYNCQSIALKNIPKPQICEIENCNEIGERHHDDYSKPLEVRWLCKKHHRELSRLE
jgi:formylmethanofuran dehydrogenase subunit E